MNVQVWSDYICPWCYLGRDRTAYLRSLGVTVTELPFELHPELPATGRTVRPDGRLAAVHELIARECAAVGLPFRAPQRIPNSRRALEVAAAARVVFPDAFAALDAALFAAHFVEGRAIDDDQVLAALVEAAGAPWDAVAAAVDEGVGRAAAAASMAIASEHNITGTPAWLFEEQLVVPGVQPRELFARVVTRLRARAGESPAGPGRTTGTRGA